MSMSVVHELPEATPLGQLRRCHRSITKLTSLCLRKDPPAVFLIVELKSSTVSVVLLLRSPQGKLWSHKPSEQRFTLLQQDFFSC